MTNSRYKTALCRSWQQGDCSSSHCQFAHGEHELRVQMQQVGAARKRSTTGTAAEEPYTEAAARSAIPIC